MPQAFYRRQLPHLQCDDRQHFITFCTDHRWILPPYLRTIVLECCLHDNGTKFDLRVAVVMPDHVHMIFTPLINQQKMEVTSLAEIMDAIKGVSAHRINKTLGRKGRVWQPESFDHVVRSSEGLDAKIQYLLDNPVRQRLAAKWEDYPWLWKKPFENPYTPGRIRSRDSSNNNVNVGTAAPSTSLRAGSRLSGRAQLARVSSPPSQLCTSPTVRQEQLPTSPQFTLAFSGASLRGQPRAAVPT